MNPAKRKKLARLAAASAKKAAVLPTPTTVTEAAPVLKVEEKVAEVVAPTVEVVAESITVEEAAVAVEAPAVETPVPTTSKKKKSI